jgi:glucose-6-phosphate 1-dehydrogenase
MVEVEARLSEAPPAPQCTLVIFGAMGDLTRRLLLPALYNLATARLLPERFAVVGVARAAMETESFRRDLGESLRAYAPTALANPAWPWLSQRLHYLRGDFGAPETYHDLAKWLEKRSAQDGVGNVLFYLATPPDQFDPIIDRLGKVGLTREDDAGWRRVIIEKPFGADLKSAQALNRKILGVLDERQVYRMDHYLGKETVQNIMVLRFANAIFEPLWNRDHIDHVQITAAETVDVEHRGKFYDATGALRDMVPSHLFQLLSLIAMEPSTCLDAEPMRSEKVKVLNSVQPLSVQSAVRGQYGNGMVKGRAVEAYRRAPDVAAESRTETFVALKLMIDSWRWAGVPFYLRTGKSLATRRTEIAVRFKRAPLALFRDTPIDDLVPNELVLCIQPCETASLSFNAKIPGPNLHIAPVEMTFDYRDHFNAAPRTGYETLIYDCMNGDAMLFHRADQIEAGWRIVQPLLDAWGSKGTAGEVSIYPAGSAGPPDADVLLARDDRQWRPIA